MFLNRFAIINTQDSNLLYRLVICVWPNITSRTVTCEIRPSKVLSGLLTPAIGSNAPNTINPL